MAKKSLLATVATVALGASLLTGVPKADAHVGISIGIPLPGVTFYAPGPPVYYSAPAYYPPAYYYGPTYYRPYYGGYYGGGYYSGYYGGGYYRWHGGGGHGGHRHWGGHGRHGGWHH